MLLFKIDGMMAYKEEYENNNNNINIIITRQWILRFFGCNEKPRSRMYAFYSACVSVSSRMMIEECRMPIRTHHKRWNTVNEKSDEISNAATTTTTTIIMIIKHRKWIRRILLCP